MARRIHVPVVRAGELLLDASQAHHARAVLRLSEGAVVEVFDDAGNAASGTLAFDGARGVIVRVDRLGIAAPDAGPVDALRWSVAAAVPKGERADWMVEKLSELGAASFIPLATARSVVLPEGRNKRDRWARIAAESAKQSRRRGVMRIEELTPLGAAIERIDAASSGGADPVHRHAGWYGSTGPGAAPILSRLSARQWTDVTVFVGPEGGWTDAEVDQFRAAGISGVRVAPTVLRVETAAVAVASVLAAVSVAGGTSKPPLKFDDVGDVP